MIGTNTLVLNAATIMEALQEYLDKRAPGFHAKVTGIQQRGPSGMFEASITRKEDGPEPSISDDEINRAAQRQINRNGS